MHCSTATSSGETMRITLVNLSLSVLLFGMAGGCSNSLATDPAPRNTSPGADAAVGRGEGGSGGVSPGTGVGTRSNAGGPNNSGLGPGGPGVGNHSGGDAVR